MALTRLDGKCLWLSPILLQQNRNLLPLILNHNLLMPI